MDNFIVNFLFFKKIYINKIEKNKVIILKNTNQFDKGFPLQKT